MPRRVASAPRRLWFAFLRAQKAGEKAVMRNRLALAAAVFFGAVAAREGGPAAQPFYLTGLPILLAFLAGSALLQAHFFWRPAPSAARLAIGFALDSLAISLGLIRGGAAAAYLFPLYWWLILGAGLRLGARFLALAVSCAAMGFAAVIVYTPFWRDQDLLAASLFVSIFLLPLYGAALLRHVAAARAEAERANHAKTLFLASVSHELRTPLTAILGLTALLDNSRLDSEQREMTRTLGDAGKSLLSQIDALLGAARDECGDPAPHAENIDLFELLLSLRAILAVEAERKGVRLGLLIEAGTPRWLRGDPRALRDIFQNVAGNAVKFTETGAVAIRVGAQRRDDAFLLRAEIRDSGIGLDPQAAARIFEPFQQADAGVQAKYGGAGLGLAIARRQLIALGGAIVCDSLPGQGARFRFEWSSPAGAAPQSEPQTDVPGDRRAPPVCLDASAPDFDSLAVARQNDLAALTATDDARGWAAARAVAAELAELTAARSPPRAPAEQKLKILLAEDNAVNGVVLKKILAAAGHEIHVVNDGLAALARMLDERFDVILLDLNMPELGGVEAAQIYAGAAPRERAPILALTADDSPARRALCAEAGMDGCLPKPIAPEALLAALRRATSRKAEGLRPESREAAALDVRTVAALRRLGGDAFLRDLAMLFARDAAALVNDLDLSLARADHPALRRQAHALESGAGNMGAAGLAALCRDWRRMTAAELMLAAPRQAARLREEWRRTLRALGAALAERRQAA